MSCISSPCLSWWGTALISCREISRRCSSCSTNGDSPTGRSICVTEFGDETLYVGTSGWQYAHWRLAFYPKQVPQRLWLEHFAARFATAEVNNTFYNLPEASVFEHWAARTPPDFTFALKMSRFLTHLKRLTDPGEPVARFLERARRLGGKRGPTLIQLPPKMRPDAGRLDATLECFGAGERVAVEFRDERWFTHEVRDVLQRRRAAFCMADGIVLSTPLWQTADWGFVPFHRGEESTTCYTAGALEAWAARLASMWTADADVFAYFNNDGHGCALRDAIRMAHLCAERGMRPTRVPPFDDVTIR